FPSAASVPPCEQSNVSCVFYAVKLPSTHGVYTNEAIGGDWNFVVVGFWSPGPAGRRIIGCRLRRSLYMGEGSGMRPTIGQGLALALMLIAGVAVSAQTMAPANSSDRPIIVSQYKPTPRAPTAIASGEGDKMAKVNSWTVGLAGGLPEGTFLRFAAEIA